jgi:hypothetical protein
MSVCHHVERTDADLAGAAKDALHWNAMVPDKRISVVADNGLITHRGSCISAPAVDSLRGRCVLSLG